MSPTAYPTTPAEYRALFCLDPEITFLNHGSFGACPRAILERQTERRMRLESEPVRYFVREYGRELDDARARLAHFLRASADCLAFVPNATFGVNCALGSIPLSPGDEIVVTNHEYNACRNVVNRAAELSGAKITVVDIPFPLTREEDVIAPLVAALNERTRILLIDHVTSATGLVMPLERILPAYRARGVAIVVDGAHAPGMIPLQLDALDVTFYTGNCHKWLCAPKGAAFLLAHREWRDRTRPVAISHGANTPTTSTPRFRHEFDWLGTHDPTAALCVPDVIEYLGSLHPDGWDGIMRSNRNKALAARRVLVEALGIANPAPESMIGSLAAVPLEDGEANEASPLYTDPLQDHLFHKHHIEVPISPWPSPPHRVLRISAQLYNDPSEYRRLADALIAARSQ